jgi:hypothetical protein
LLAASRGRHLETGAGPSFLGVRDRQTRFKEGQPCEQSLTNNVPDAFRTPGGTDALGFEAPTIIDPATGARLGLSCGNPITEQYDFNVNAGGPVRKGHRTTLNPQLSYASMTNC